MISAARKQARDLAENTIRGLARDGVAAAVELIRDRIDWRWGAGAVLLALEAEHMMVILTFTRASKIRRRYWKWLWIRRAARAWAVDPTFAEQCKICKTGAA
jgi:hypothetical protein